MSGWGFLTVICVDMFSLCLLCRDIGDSFHLTALVIGLEVLIDHLGRCGSKGGR